MTSEYRDLPYSDVKDHCLFEKQGIPHKQVGGTCRWCYDNMRDWHYNICSITAELGCDEETHRKWMKYYG